MDRSVEDDNTERFPRLFSSSSSPSLAYLDIHADHTSTKQLSQGFDFSAQDVLSGYDLHTSSRPRRGTYSVENVSIRRHRLSGSPVYVTRELITAKKEAEMDHHSSKIATAVDRTIKKHADNIMRVLEGMNGRLSHLELVSQGLENSVSSLKASVDGYHDEADARLMALNSHVMKMHQAVQFLRDKQDIVERNAELAKLKASKAEVVQPVGSSQIVNQEQLAVISSLVPRRYSTELQVSEKLQQLSVSADANGLPQQPKCTQGGHTLQSIQQPQALSQSELSPTFQTSEKLQSMPGVLQAQSEHAQSQQFAQSRQGVFQAQPQHMQSMLGVQLQQGSFQASQQQVYSRPSFQSQEGVSQAQQHVWAEQTLPFQQGAFQSQQAHYVQPQQGLQARQGVIHAQMQQSAQSYGGSFQSQEQSQQYVQLEQGVVQAQSQQQVQAQAQAQQSFPPDQGGPPQSQQGGVIQAQAQQGQAKQIFQLHQSNLPSHSMGAQMLAQPPYTQQAPNSHFPLQGVHPEQGSFQITQQNESLAHAPLSQATTKYSPYSAGPYDVSNIRSSQQYPFSSQPIPPPQLSNSYHRVPSSLQGSQPVYASHMARPASSSAIAGANALPMPPRNVYDQPLSGLPLNQAQRGWQAR